MAKRNTTKTATADDTLDYYTEREYTPNGWVVTLYRNQAVIGQTVCETSDQSWDAYRDTAAEAGRLSVDEQRNL